MAPEDAHVGHDAQDAAPLACEHAEQRLHVVSRVRCHVVCRAGRVATGSNRPDAGSEHDAVPRQAAVRQTCEEWRRGLCAVVVVVLLLVRR